ncbi:hypothetical protein SELMODRAFT_108947 [Selaginella moellendorffii]|uniref:SGNH hydrolase-type esterase domain-containing protein n=1 Tax=Selaginella moellendorffii TaxID=88036 RepID=D8S5F0_SELML|nr:hypothetical protein SELMODRAFT_108947 [Selaginella moellendorffii]
MLPTKPASAMFVFGDSILDAGSAKFLPPNSSVAALSPPYGETYFKVSTGRFSDGRTLADFLAQWINLPFTRSYMDPDAVLEIGANFASAGSRLIGEYAGAVSFKTQIDQFTERVGLLRERYGDDRAKTILRDSVFIVAIGSNDLEALYFPTNSSFRRIGSSWRYYVGMMMEEYEAAVKTLYNQGARKIVLVGVGPIGCAPAARYYVAKVGLITRRQKIGCLQTLNEMAAFFNKSLRNLVNKMLFQLPELAMVFLKPYGLLMDAVRSPLENGFTNSREACCGDGLFHAGGCNNSSFVCPVPSTHLFWDSVHLTEAANLFLFRYFWFGDLRAAEPYNLKRLLA